MLSKAKIAVFVSLGVVALTGVASAEEKGLPGCIHARKEVARALEANQTSPNFDEAKTFERAGQEYCQAGMYDEGMGRYSKALHLLGTAVTTTKGPTNS